jgi:hypothetical protein
VSKPKFTIDDGESLRGKEGPALRKIKDALEGLKFGSLLSFHGLASKTEYSFQYLHIVIAAGTKDLSGYRLKDGKRYLYGSRKTISALRKDLNGKKK